MTNTAVQSAQNQTGERSRQTHRYLMCRPDHFTVSYRINPWMEPARPTDTALAVRQWQVLYDTYRALGHEVQLIDPVPGLPDMVYTANGGFTLDGIAYGARFRFAERAPEAEYFDEWFAAHGFEVVKPSQVNEGEGDFLLAGDVILGGTGFRSSGESHREVAEVFGREVLSLNLVEPRFYHLDTALTVLDPVVEAGDTAGIAYLPSAFDEASRGVLAERFPDAIQVRRWRRLRPEQRQRRLQRPGLAAGHRFRRPVARAWLPPGDRRPPRVAARWRRDQVLHPGTAGRRRLRRLRRSGNRLLVCSPTRFAPTSPPTFSSSATRACSRSSAN